MFLFVIPYHKIIKQRNCYKIYPMLKMEGRRYAENPDSSRIKTPGTLKKCKKIAKISDFRRIFNLIVFIARHGAEHVRHKRDFISRTIDLR